MIDLIIIAPSDSLTNHVPGGFIFADEVFSEASLQDSISAAQKAIPELDKTLSYLVKRFPRRIRVRRVSLWSLGGLWFAFRFRLRHYPVVIVNQSIVLQGEDLKPKALIDRIGDLLSKTDHSE